MVFLAFFLVAVSTLATHINAEPTDELVIHHACEGEIFCDVKPDNYPQEEIDRLLIKHLPYLHRMKREVIEPAPPSGTEGNCEVTESVMTSPFTLRNKDAVPRLIVQSKWFDQKVPRVSCRNEQQCFSSYTLYIDEMKAKCVQKTLQSTLVVYNPKKKDLENVRTETAIDCACVMSENTAEKHKR